MQCCGGYLLEDHENDGYSLADGVMGEQKGFTFAAGQCMLAAGTSWQIAGGSFAPWSSERMVVDHDISFGGLGRITASSCRLCMQSSGVLK